MHTGIHTCIHTHMHTYIHTYIHIRAYTRIHIYIRHPYLLGSTPFYWFVRGGGGGIFAGKKHQ